MAIHHKTLECIPMSPCLFFGKDDKHREFLGFRLSMAWSWLPKALVLANSVTSDTVGVVLFAIRVAARAKLKISFFVDLWEGRSLSNSLKIHGDKRLMYVFFLSKNEDFRKQNFSFLYQKS